MMLLAQIPTPPSGAIENWLISAAALASMALLFKKLFFRKTPLERQFAEKGEFFLAQEKIERELTVLRDKIDDRFLILGEKIEQMKWEILTAGEKRGSSIHRRLNELESGLARVDERSKS